MPAAASSKVSGGSVPLHRNGSLLLAQKTQCPKPQLCCLPVMLSRGRRCLSCKLRCVNGVKGCVSVCVCGQYCSADKVCITKIQQRG